MAHPDDRSGKLMADILNEDMEVKPGAVRYAPACSDPTAVLIGDRGKQHGDFYEQGRITQALQRQMEDSPNWARLNGMAQEGLHMIVHKIARILAGDPTVLDHWDDIQGYARCVRDRIANRGIWRQVES